MIIELQLEVTGRQHCHRETLVSESGVTPPGGHTCALSDRGVQPTETERWKISGGEEGNSCGFLNMSGHPVHIWVNVVQFVQHILTCYFWKNNMHLKKKKGVLIFLRFFFSPKEPFRQSTVSSPPRLESSARPSCRVVIINTGL